VLTVSNTGQEVPADLLGVLFEPFVRAAPRTRGSRNSHGLGMAIVRAVTEAHRGTVTAQANPGGGLTVTVRLPEPEDTKHRRNHGSGSMRSTGMKHLPGGPQSHGEGKTR
jgi:signal transduction histidine kinase